MSQGDVDFTRLFLTDKAAARKNWTRTGRNS
jgi:hypothetical protein